MENDYSPEQILLMRIRDERCAGNAADLARKIEKDATYVNRLFYPIGKKGRKGIGLDVMRECTRVFQLPPGYWEGAAASPVKKGAVFDALSSEERELIAHWRHMLGKDRRAKLAEIAALAEERLAERDELFAEAGITAIQERAAHASRKRTAATAVEVTDKLKQQSLLDDSLRP